MEIKAGDGRSLQNQSRGIEPGSRTYLQRGTSARQRLVCSSSRECSKVGRYNQAICRHWPQGRPTSGFSALWSRWSLSKPAVRSGSCEMRLGAGMGNIDCCIAASVWAARSNEYWILQRGAKHREFRLCFDHQ